MIKVFKHSFGKTRRGAEIFNYILKGAIEADVSAYGATLVSLKVPDKNGKPVDVVLGYDNLLDYEINSKYLGATVGRCCNRIENAEFELNGVLYRLVPNDGKNHLHGGLVGFNTKVWEAEEIQKGVKFSYSSPDKEEGYPANLKVSVTYTIEDSALKIHYTAQADNDTVCNLTNHAYFNLRGEGNILSQKVKIYADYFTENNEESLPTGKILSVENTPLDFREYKTIGADIDNSYEQIKFARGFDNNWVIRDFDGSVKLAAEAYDEISGIKLKVLTDYPGIQFYSGNYLDGSTVGKNSVPIKNCSAFCLECQYFPNALKHKNFPQPILLKGNVYDKTIIYRFENVSQKF